MIIVIILSLGLLSYKLIDKKKCTPFSFRIKHISLIDSIYYTGEPVTFTASLNDPDILWNLGDNTQEQEGSMVTHKFLKEGTYIITASLNGGCANEQKITVLNPLQIQATPDNVSTDNKILGRSTIFRHS